MENLTNSADEASESTNKTFVNDDSEIHDNWNPMSMLIAVVLAFLILLTTAGNLVVCRLVWVCRRMRIPSYYFVVSMSLSDFLMGMLVIPISLAYHINFQTTGNKLSRLAMISKFILLNSIHKNKQRHRKVQLKSFYIRMVTL